MNLNTEEIDTTIENVETLYERVTGQEAPSELEEPYAAIPPERDPVEYVEEQLNRLNAALSGLPGMPPDATLTPTPTPMQPTWAPPVSVWQSSDRFVIQVDLPGVPRASVNIDLQGGTLSITGSRPRPSPDGTKAAQRVFSERPDGRFHRSIALPAGATAGELSARMQNGVLEIRVPRSTGSQRIEVN